MQRRDIWCFLLCLTLFARTFRGTAVSGIATLDAEKCSKERKGCCEYPHVIMDDVTVKCVMHYHNKGELPADDEKNPIKLISFLSCLTHCIYKKRNYLVKGDEDINMQAVKTDLETLYADRPKEQQYYIELYEFCRKDALQLYSVTKNNPAARVFFKKACKPYYLFVYLCQTDYHKKTICPYFVWRAEENSPAAQECKAAQEQCYKIDGITVTEESRHEF